MESKLTKEEREQRFERRKASLNALTFEQRDEACNFDEFELSLLADYIPTMDYEKAIETISESVEGDYSQLSIGMLHAYKRMLEQEDRLSNEENEINIWIKTKSEAVS
ncbi:MAG: hypothetical protein ABI361_06970 [Nitrososphaera sp.]|jgi:hypothetical protein